MQKIWNLIFVLTFLISVFFVVKSIRELYVYFSLDGKVEGRVIHSEIVEKGSSSYALALSFEFWVEGDERSGRVELVKPYFLNIPSAEKAAEELSKKKWDVFYRTSDPNISALQKNFPFKSCIQAILTLGVFIYFVFLKKTVERSV